MKTNVLEQGPDAFAVHSRKSKQPARATDAAE
jgi:hypothetical protein